MCTTTLEIKYVSDINECFEAKTIEYITVSVNNSSEQLVVISNPDSIN